MSIIGKLHEISFYGIVTSLVCLVGKLITFSDLKNSAIHVSSFQSLFYSYLFWSIIVFIPIAIIGGFYTKYYDHGEGLSFKSDNIIVIIFAHIAEELLGLFLSPFWFLRDLFTKNLSVGKVVDYALYCVELIFIFMGLYSILH